MPELIPLQDDCDPAMVEALITAAARGMSRAVVPDITTQAEIMSAVFTLLDRTLRSFRKIQDPADRFVAAQQISKALSDLLIDHGHVPS